MGCSIRAFSLAEASCTGGDEICGVDAFIATRAPLADLYRPGIRPLSLADNEISAGSCKCQLAVRGPIF